MTPEIAFTFFDKILDVIGLVRENKLAKKQEKKEALIAIVDALQQTQRYIKAREQGAPRDIDREWNISEIWRGASISVSNIDKTLAGACWEKGGYWMAPDAWSKEMVAAKGIAISQLEEKIPDLMGLGRS